MAPLVSRLENRELVERRPVDGRSHGLQLTAAGRAMTLQAKKSMKSHEDQLLAKIPAETRAAFLSASHALWDIGE